ncbi:MULTISPECIES: IclR family transcriptional regulator [unclassified Paraburkholderia]|uniref:IclR family transcriptional regulator n=1 Tax=unclassified Paraburkholderia TaxID=2615204 RepID=UPI002AB01950|nr:MULTISPECIES: IclR family transcriptional regulator [unclassified Paraburkholderia]
MDVKSAARVLDVINLFSETRRPMFYSEIARRTGIPFSSCYALLKTMVNKGYLYAPDCNGTYYPTRRLLHVSLDICREDPLALFMRPLLVTLRDKTNETAALATLAGNRVVYLDVVESRHKYRYSDEPGGFSSLHASAAGRAILGTFSAAARRRFLESYNPIEVSHGGAIFNRATLELEIDEGVARGWHRSTDESIDGAAGLSCGFAIRGLPFSFGIIAPRERIFGEDRMIVDSLIKVLSQISQSFKI